MKIVPAAILVLWVFVLQPQMKAVPPAGLSQAAAKKPASQSNVASQKGQFEKIECEDFAGRNYQLPDSGASGEMYASRASKSGSILTATNALFKYPVPDGLGEAAVWIRVRNFEGTIELRDRKVGEEAVAGEKIVSWKLSKRINVADTAGKWNWVNLGSHDLSSIEFIVPYISRSCPEDAGLDCIILTSDLTFEPKSQ